MAVHESLNELMPWMLWSHPEYSVEESRTWLKEQVEAFKAQSAFEFAITSDEGGYLGGVGLNQIDRPNRRANLGYWVRTSATSRGVCTSAVQQIRDWGFANTDLIRLEILVATGNVISQRVAEKAGALREGTLRKRLMLRDAVHDAVIFSLTRVG